MLAVMPTPRYAGDQSADGPDAGGVVTVGVSRSFVTAGLDAR